MMFEDYLVDIVDALMRSGMTETEALRLVTGLLASIVEPSELLSNLLACDAPMA